MSATNAIAELRDGDRAIHISDLVRASCTRAARPLELATAAGSANGPDSTLCLLQIGQRATTLQSDYFKLVEEANNGAERDRIAVERCPAPTAARSLREERVDIPISLLAGEGH